MDIMDVKDKNITNNSLIKFYFDKKRIVLGVAILIAFSCLSIWFIKEPEIFIRNFLMKKEHIQLFGYIALISSLIMTLAYIVLLFRKKEALIISDDYLIDNSKFESAGKIYFSEIKDIKKFKKYNVEIVLKDSIFKLKDLNIFQKIVFLLNNWYSKRYSILITCAHILDCDRDKLYSILRKTYEKSKSS